MLHPGHVNGGYDEVNTDVREKRADSMATAPQGNLVPNPLLPCTRKYKKPCTPYNYFVLSLHCANFRKKYSAYLNWAK